MDPIDPLNIFQSFDKDGNGHISFNEMDESKKILETIMKEKNQAKEILDVATIFQELDLNNNGIIEPKEVDNSLDGNLGH